jgi:hypothetical protein
VIEFTHEEIVMASICEPGILIVASADPDPPFDILQRRAGFPNQTTWSSS